MAKHKGSHRMRSLRHSSSSYPNAISPTLANSALGWPRTHSGRRPSQSHRRPARRSIGATLRRKSTRIGFSTTSQKFIAIGPAQQGSRRSTRRSWLDSRSRVMKVLQQSQRQAPVDDHAHVLQGEGARGHAVAHGPLIPRPQRIAQCGWAEW